MRNMYKLYELGSTKPYYVTTETWTSWTFDCDWDWNREEEKDNSRFKAVVKLPENFLCQTE